METTYWGTLDKSVQEFKLQRDYGRAVCLVFMVVLGYFLVMIIMTSVIVSFYLDILFFLLVGN